ncbi:MULTISPECIES: HNH endonuclease signature motif containing protein [unclassified Microcoleus]|uniref:HNH endonuclease signature motif containing protein n=1 Tax=unclassified Microcoleus TaxID=2642155 RepID=UPI002FD6A959
MDDRSKERFEKHIISKDNCWLTDLWCNQRGYGQFHLKRSRMNASRASFLIYNGEIPEGMFVCHKCDNPPCVNPEHLFLGTHTENMRDMVEKGRSNRGSKNPQSKLTEKEVFQIKALLVETNLTVERISVLFDVSQRTIAYIKQNDIWKHVNYIANSNFSNTNTDVNKNSNRNKNKNKPLEWKQLSLFD